MSPKSKYSVTKVRRQIPKPSLLIAADHLSQAAALVAQTRCDVLNGNHSVRLGRLADGLYDLIPSLRTLAEILGVQNLPETPFIAPTKQDRSMEQSR